MISNFGNVLSTKRKIWNGKGYYTKESAILKPIENHKGYFTVRITFDDKKKTLPIHRLVALSFIQNPNNLPQVNHIDGDKKNNNVKNLEWCDNSYNQLHAFRIGLHKVSENSGRKKIKVLKRDKDTKEVIGKYNSIAEASRENRISKCCVTKGIYKRTKNGISGGFVWDINLEKELENE